MNVLHGGASRADCYEKHTSTDTDTHTLLHFNPTRKMIEPNLIKLNNILLLGCRKDISVWTPIRGVHLRTILGKMV